jgi:hypothetical protein
MFFIMNNGLKSIVLIFGNFLWGGTPKLMRIRGKENIIVAKSDNVD